MYYPVQVDGALFSIGDPHVSQGDGEISGTAIESSLNVTMQIVLRKDFRFPTPLLETADSWIVHGFDQRLDQALRNASLDTMQLLEEHLGLSRNDAYSLMSVAGDVGITQVVDATLGAHVRLPRGIFPKLGQK
jgi:acetamidase/formamidase